MEIFSTIQTIKDCLLHYKEKTIGFVPTMGALHRGHTSLLERAKRENDISVASIFVNPLQFNDKKDLEKYLRTPEQDIEKLKSAQCDFLFTPAVDEMYPEKPEDFIDLGELDKVMEGLHRPGHFQGVCTVVKKLFDIIEPHKAYFGEKDFQQLAVIRQMVKTLNIPVKIIPCPTVREADGLAMSSRNMLLTSDERKNAAHIYKTLVEAKGRMKDWKDGKFENTHPSTITPFHLSIADLKKWVEEKINENPFFQLQYFEIVNSETLLPVQSWEETKNLRACIAVKVGTVRLIDNISM